MCLYVLCDCMWCLVVVCVCLCLGAGASSNDGPIRALVCSAVCGMTCAKKYITKLLVVDQFR